jgi:hypothetical protein
MPEKEKSKIKNEQIIRVIIIMVFLFLFLDYFIVELTPDKIHAIKLSIINITDLLHFVISHLR